MKSFSEVRISTVSGIIFLLLIAGSIGLLIFYQMRQIVDIQMSAIERQLSE